MKKIKKIFVWALAACMMFSGCSKGGGNESVTAAVSESAVSEAGSDISSSSESGVDTSEADVRSTAGERADLTTAVEAINETSDVGTTAEISAVTSTAETVKQTAAAETDTFTEKTEVVVSTEKEPAPVDPIGDIIDNMSLEEKVGQIILVRYSADTAAKASQYHFGGYTLYAVDFAEETPESIQAKLEKIRTNSLLPPFFAADEEGGSVIRISKYTAFSDSPLPALGSDEAKGDIKGFAAKMAEVLKKGGINLNLAPVADVAENESDYIYDRTCREGYERTGEIIGELVRELNGRNVISCLKHFPGYGSNVDTHTGITFDGRTKESFEGKDFIPFKAGINANVPMIMVNHNIVGAYNDKVPASLAPEIHQSLRDMGFKGVIVTDDLGMGAITKYSDSPYADAVLAGNDLLCTSDGANCYEAVLEAVKSGVISEDRLDESIYRILRVKINYGILKL